MQTFALVPTPVCSIAPQHGATDVSEADGIEMAGRVYRNDAGTLAVLDVSSGSLERDQMQRTLRRKLAIALIHNLPAKQRYVIVRRFFEDSTMNEIAAELKCTLQSVARLQAKALTRLRESKELKEYFKWMS